MTRWKNGYIKRWSSAILILMIFPLFCAGEVSVVGSVPTHSEYGIKYGVSNLVDKNLATAFCAPTNEKFWFKVTGEKLAGLGIVNGYAKSPTTFSNNSRPRKVWLSSRNKKRVFVLRDSPEAEWIDVEEGDYLLFDAENYYDGKKYPDACVSEIITNRLTFNIYSALSSSKQAKGPKISLLFSADELNINKNSNLVLDALAILTSTKDESSLRNLLETIKYSDSGEHYNSEFNWSLKRFIEGYITNNPEVVLKVMRDKKQTGRSYVLNAWDNMLGFSTYETSQDLINDPKADAKLKSFAEQIERYRFLESN